MAILPFLQPGASVYRHTAARLVLGSLRMVRLGIEAVPERHTPWGRLSLMMRRTIMGVVGSDGLVADLVGIGSLILQESDEMEYLSWMQTVAGAVAAFLEKLVRD